jgi:hypothetical protein
MSLRCTRRDFLTLAPVALAAPFLPAQDPSLANISVAKLEQDRVLAEAQVALTRPVPVITVTPAPASAHLPPNQFFSELQPNPQTAGDRNPPTLFRDQARALRELSTTIACFAAAFVLTRNPAFASRAATHLRPNFLIPTTRLQPTFDTAGCTPGSTIATPAGVLDLVPLAELARALTFFIDSVGPNFISDAEWDTLQSWFQSANAWLNTNRTAQIARDTRDHRASAWLLTCSSLTRFLRDEPGLEDCRKLFRKPTLRNQIRPDGVFPQEVATPDPYRNTLFNFDLLTGACQVLNTPFDQLWSYELIDGVGLRIVSAYLYPLIAHPERWPFVADAVRFRELPHRRPGLLFAGRAYNRPEYVELWQQLPAGPPPADIAATLPIRQPLLWTTRPPHGL